MLKRLLFILSVIGLSPVVSYAQEGRITGRVVDAETQSPIPFASINLREEQTGALTNEYGYFQLAMPTKVTEDSIVVMALGYKRTALFVKRGANMEEVILQIPKQPIALANVVVEASKVKPLMLGAHSNSPGAGMIQGMPGSQYAFLCKNEKAKGWASCARYRFISAKTASRASPSGCASTRPTATTAPPTRTCSARA